MTELQFALRQLQSNRAFTAATVLLLSLGIAANTLIFSAVDALLLRSLPVREPERLVRVIHVQPNGSTNAWFSYLIYTGVRDKATSFSDVLTQTTDVTLPMSGRDFTERVNAHFVSGNFFEALGVKPLLGRFFQERDGSEPAWPAVLSYGFWQRRFGGDRGVLGATIQLKGHPFVIVGVLPKDFNGLQADTAPDVRIPIGAMRLVTDIQMNDFFASQAFEIIGRMKPSVSVAQASAECVTLVSALTAEGVATRPDVLHSIKRYYLEGRFNLESIARGASSLRSQFGRALLALLAAVALLLLLVCSNVAGLLLVRSEGRRREIAVRLAVGCSRGRLIRQLLIESSVLAALGGLGGVLIAYAAKPLLTSAIPPIRNRMGVLLPLALRIEIDLRVLGFTMAVCCLAALLCGLAPALRSARTDLNTVLRQSARQPRRRATNFLVASQVALSAILLAGAGLLAATLSNLRRLDGGFDRDHIVMFTVDPSMNRYTPEQARSLQRQLNEATSALPGVRAVGSAARGLMRGTGFKTTIAPEGRPSTVGDFMNTSINSVSPGYFDAMGMRFLAGRDFTGAEKVGELPRKVVVNQAFVRQIFGGGNPIGRDFGSPTRGGGRTYEVIGVVSDAKYRSLREEIPPTFYWCVCQAPESTEAFILHVRTTGDPRPVIGAVRSILRGLDPRMPFVEVTTLAEEVETSLWQEKLVASLATGFAALAALLAGIGLFGMLSSTMIQRTREIGIRMALGARPAGVARLIGSQVCAVSGVGIAAGLFAWLTVARWIGKLLYGVPPADPLILLLAAGVVLAVVFLFSIVPAWRATRIDPAVTLRIDQ